MSASNAVMGLFCAAVGGFLWMFHDANAHKDPPTPAAAGFGSVLRSTKPVLVEFYADWCGPCQMVGPKVDELAIELRGKAEVVRLNVDQNHDLAAKYNVHGIPCFIAFKRGKETARELGAIPTERMKSMIGM